MEAMLLYLIRHAEAVSRDSAGGSDDERVLSPAGREIMENIAQWCVGQKLLVEQIISSPLVRAVQTAEILAAALHLAERIDVHKALGTAGSAGQIQRFLPEIGHLNAVALVGHEPTIGITASLLLDIEKKVTFSPGSICCLAFHGCGKSPQASFRWMTSAVHDQKANGVAITTVSDVELL